MGAHEGKGKTWGSWQNGDRWRWENSVSSTPQGQAALPLPRVQIEGFTSSTWLWEYGQESGVERWGRRQRDTRELAWSPRPAGLTRASASPSGMLDDGRDVEAMREGKREEGRRGRKGRGEKAVAAGRCGRGWGQDRGWLQAGVPGSHEDAFALDAVCPLLFAGALAIDVEAHVPACLQREQLLKELLDVVVHLG